jgi:hypothetical protein
MHRPGPVCRLEVAKPAFRDSFASQAIADRSPYSQPVAITFFDPAGAGPLAERRIDVGGPR